MNLPAALANYWPSFGSGHLASIGHRTTLLYVFSVTTVTWPRDILVLAALWCQLLCSVTLHVK